MIDSINSADYSWEQGVRLYVTSPILTGWSLCFSLDWSLLWGFEGWAPYRKTWPCLKDPPESNKEQCDCWAPSHHTNRNYIYGFGFTVVAVGKTIGFVSQSQLQQKDGWREALYFIKDLTTCVAGFAVRNRRYISTWFLLSNERLFVLGHLVCMIHPQWQNAALPSATLNKSIPSPINTKVTWDTGHGPQCCFPCYRWNESIYHYKKYTGTHSLLWTHKANLLSRLITGTPMSLWLSNDHT